MPRPRKLRSIQAHPVVTAFVPEGVPLKGTETTVLPLEGLEAIKLNDVQGLDQESAAKVMNVSRQTFGRILVEARAIVADALVSGKVLRIEGGHFDIARGGAGRRRRRGRR
ncbi:MAG: DUF134 domain-containing protein [Deltaproteobacteria bacterium]|nr:DUF134 domain-containing protein [Deltaproteobacteria bacterium]